MNPGIDPAVRLMMKYDNEPESLNDMSMTRTMTTYREVFTESGYTVCLAHCKPTVSFELVFHACGQ